MHFGVPWRTDEAHKGSERRREATFQGRAASCRRRGALGWPGALHTFGLHTAHSPGR